MLQSIHDRAQGWIAWAIVILISIPFALWGIQSYLGIGSEPVVAKVNGVEIAERALDRQVQVTRMRLRDQLGAAYDAAGIDERQLRQQVLDEMVRQALLVDVSDRMGFRVSNQELRARIAAEPAFQRNGHFDKEVYDRSLSMQGMSSQMFADNLRRQILGTQLVRGVVGSELATAAELDALASLQGQKREVSWVLYPAADFASDTPPDASAIDAYYQEHSDRFETPEQVKLDYLVLDVDTLAKTQKVSEQELRQAYDSEQARFGQPERRAVRHILLTVPAGADAAKEAAVREQILEVRKRITGGESFEAVAKEVSQDPGSAAQGGSLGEIEPGIMDPAFDKAAFALKPGVVSEPVRSRFGFHLIEVDSVTPAQVKPFAEVRDQLRTEVARRKAESLYYDLGERLANLVYESPDSLQPAAEALGLEVQHSDWISRKGGEGILANPKITAAAFSDDVLKAGNNSDIIEPEKDTLRAVVVRVADHREPSLRPLDQVRDEIITALRDDAARKGAADAAKAAADKVAGGDALSAVAGEREAQSPGLVGRKDPGLPAPVRQVAFTLPPAAQGKPAVGTAGFDNGDSAVVLVSKVVDADPKAMPAAQREGEGKALVRVLGRSDYEVMMEDMEARADIERRAPKAPEEGG